MKHDESIEQIRKTLDLAGSELEILHRISQSISCSLDLDEVLREIIDLVVQVIRGDSCLLYLLDDASESLVLRASKNPHPRIIGRIALKVGEGITGWVAREARPVAIPRNAGKDGRFKFFHNLPEDRYEAFLSVPIVAPTDRVIGVINVQHRRARRYAEQEVTLLSIIGHQVGAAIQNARLFQETERQAQQLAALARVGRIILSGAYLDEMLQAIAGFAADVMHAAHCSIYLFDAARRELTLKAVKSASGRPWVQQALRSADDLFGTVIKEARPAAVEDLAGRTNHPLPELVHSEGLRSVLCVPLAVKGRTLGLINAYTAERRRFSPEEVRLLSTIADQTALAIENTRLVFEAQETQQALESRKIMDRAKGILQRGAGLSEDEAYRRIQEQSMRSRRSMREIAEAVILASELESKP